LAGPVQELADLVLSPGLLEFDARVGPQPHRLWIKGLGGEAGEVTPPADSGLALTLVPAMREGGTLRVDGDVSPRVLRMQREFQGIQQAWSHQWSTGEAPLKEVLVEAGARSVPVGKGNGRVAAFFSGGVDSWATVLAEPEITDLIFVKGVDILPTLSPRHVGLGERVEQLLREMAGELGKPLHVVELKIREFADPLIDWGVFYNSGLCAIALFFESLFDRVLIPTDSDHATQQPLGASRMIDGLWATEALEIVDHGGQLGRFDRTRLLADSQLAQQSLRVCYMNYDRMYNCGRCPKCNLTMLSLEALGARERFPTFPSDFDFSELEEYTPRGTIHLLLWEDCLRGIEACGREDLARVVRPVVERGTRLFADPALAAAQEEAAAAQAQLREVLDSTSWRITEPLRRATSAVRKARARRR
jgi:hypothetical protein